ncbi:hypothetical protein VOLCADRAFT_96596 [Volvox carteri f. nagariensis]|uniref:Tbc2 translation factor, chloroplastic n=1 Tax=Volvox carteri f. nagariensis TaxID=3068 RepID=D8UAI9_VOLCA|nr:uncharacterized protein VOLCADRAFT_96596 [Volvox carteri f. nagariensis]EFJ43268.1 hypothetical protein VOLCADRAFT_96596 [Volvox carteri f. nagariensis]|eukprot:XP_002955628.1 hypothetical protein VOLCADRAFT_96596 [Volvox carteri f. nagariensis]
MLPVPEGDCGSPPSLREIHRLLPYLTPNQLTDTLWYFAQHGMKPSTGLMGAVAERIRSSLSQCKGQDLSKTLWAFATLKYMPSEAWWRDFEGQVFGALTDLTDRELANLLWAFAGDPVEASSRPIHAEAAANLFSSSLTEETEEAAAAGSADQGVWTPGPWLHMSPPSGGPELRGWVLDPLLAHSCAGGFAGYSATSLHLLVWSLGKLHYTPPAAWLESFLPAAEAHFFRFTPTELANIIWALAKLGARLPSEWLDKLLLVAQWRFPSFPARLLSIVAWSTATLNHRPQQEWLMCFEEQVRAKFLDFSGHELACVAWSLRRFGYSTRDNAVFYMLQKQQHFLAADFEILSNPKLLRQVLGWKASPLPGSCPVRVRPHNVSFPQSRTICTLRLAPSEGGVLIAAYGPVLFAEVFRA